MLFFLKKFSTITVLLCIATASAIAIPSYLVTFENQDNGKAIPDGITIGGLDVARLSPEEARQVLQEKFPSVPEKASLTLTSEKRMWNIPFVRLNAVYNYRLAVEQALQISEDPLSKLELLWHERNIPLAIQIDTKKLREELVAINQYYSKPAQNARLILENNTLKIIPEQPGRHIDIEKTVKSVLHALSAKNNLSIPKIPVVVKTVMPDITSKDLCDINKQLAVFATTFDQEEKNRLKNMQLAVQAIDGTILKPGEVFSFNGQTGPRLPQKGYREATAIISGSPSPSIGGGICQVATTLYNAALLAGLSIKERTPHSRPVSYVTPGLDATVADNSTDLKFINTSKNHVFISARVVDNQLIVKIFGKESDPSQKIKINPEVKIIQPGTIVKKDNSLSPGEVKVVKEGEKGYEVYVYRLFFKGKKEIKKELISHDYYRPVDTVIKVGPKLKADK